ncbi:hypothetical protein BH18ACT3_BH18ACT3_23750 [soil metagenome]
MDDFVVARNPEEGSTLPTSCGFRWVGTGWC